MTQQYWKDRLHLITAFANDEQIQYNFGEFKTYTDWQDVTYLDFASDVSKYRIKPKDTNRPWTIDEVPIGALIKWTTEPAIGCKGFDVAMITGKSGNRVLFGIQSPGYNSFTCQTLFERCSHSLDGGKTWLPCASNI